MTEPHRDEIAKLEALHGEHPEGRVFTHLAEAYRKAGEHSRALETIEAGLVRHPEYASAHVVRGRVLLDLGQEEGAAAAFRSVLELDRHNLIALRALGDLARNGGRSDEALGYFRDLLNIDPSDPELAAEVERLGNAASTEAEAAGGDAPDTSAPEVTAIENYESTPDEDGVAGAPAAADEAAVDAAHGAVDLDEAVAGVTEPLPEGSDAEEAFLTLESVHLAESDVESDVDDRAEPVEERPWPDSWWSGEETAVEEMGAVGAGGEEVGEWGAGEAAGAHEEPAPEGGASASPDLHWTFPGWGEEEEAAVEVRTETMAALYAAQGLWGRAAEIYRSLLEERPGDPGLEERLKEADAKIEQGMDTGAAPATGDQAASGPGEQWLEGVESAWTGGHGVAAPAASPYDWEDDAEDDAQGPSAGEYLRSLAEWRPGAGADPGTADEVILEADEGEAALREWLAEEPAETAPTTETDWPPPSAVEPAGEELPGEDDEDVEMFRTWLQSLRK